MSLIVDKKRKFEDEELGERKRARRNEQPPQIRTLPLVSLLVLQDCRFDDFKGALTTSKLTSISLRNIDITFINFHALLAAPHLTKIHLQGCCENYWEQLPHNWQHLSLKTIQIMAIKISITSLKKIYNSFPALKHATFEDCTISDDNINFNQQTKIVDLTIASSRLHDLSLARIMSMSSVLKRLSLCDCKTLSSRGIATAICMVAGQIDTLDLSGTAIESAHIKELMQSHLPKLEYLYLNRTALSREELDDLPSGNLMDFEDDTTEELIDQFKLISLQKI